MFSMPRIQEGVSRSSDQSLEFLADAALVLGNHALTRQDIHASVAQMLRDHLEGGFVVFSSFRRERGALQVECVAGAGEGLSEAIRLFQTSCPGGMLPIPEKFPWRTVSLPVLMPMPGGLFELTFGALDQEKARLLETRMGISHCWLLGLGRGSQFLGTLALLLGPGQPAPDHRVVETFGTLVTLTLLARRAIGPREGFGQGNKTGAKPEEPNAGILARRVLEDQVEAICRYDTAGRLMFVNDPFCRLFHHRPEELLGQPAMGLVHSRDRRRRRRHLAALTPEAPVGEIEHRVVRGDGTIAWIQWVDRAIFDREGRVVEYQSVGRDVTLRRQAEERMAWLATHDSLTGLPNRVLLKDRLSLMIHRSGRSGRPFAVALLDLDGFKEVNDRHGHAAGDEVLRALGGLLARTFRRSDTVARLGGDEFVVLVGDCGNGGGRPPWLEKLERCLASPLDLERPRVTVTVGASVGVVVACGHDADPDVLLHQADRAMYAAKRAGKGRAVFFDEAALAPDDDEGSGSA